MLQALQVFKRFDAVQALEAVDFQLRPGEIHGLVGENGAGKSTLLKILAGVYPPDAGRLFLEGSLLQLRDPRHAYQVGIRIVHQELSLVPTLSVAENLFLHEFAAAGLRLVDRSTLTARARRLLDEWELDVSTRCPVESLPLGKRQLVEIARELAREARILILDEPTSSLAQHEIDRLFEVLRKLKQQDVAIVLVSHRLHEVLALADTVTVLRNGRKVDSRPAAGLRVQDVVTMMAGRDLLDLFPHRASHPSEPVLSVRGLTAPGFSDVSFDLRRGEILGIGGLTGSGRSELLRSLFGVHRVTQGEIVLEGRLVKISRPLDAIELGLVLLSENRFEEGIFPDLSVAMNLVVMKLDELTRGGWLSPLRIKAKVERLVRAFGVATHHAHCQPARELSGGNQQKVVLARLLGAEPRILLLDEPTRGVDVGTRVDIHGMMADFAARGNAMIMVSSDLPELIGMCDRILVLNRGQLAAEFVRDEFNEERILGRQGG